MYTKVIYINNLAYIGLHIYIILIALSTRVCYYLNAQTWQQGSITDLYNAFDNDPLSSVYITLPLLIHQAH